jgi:predicted MFS family arabinose efflux permease
MTTDTQHAAPPTGRLPLVTWILAAGVFLMGTTEFVVAGILPEIAEDLGIPVSRGGMMIEVMFPPREERTRA